MIIKAYKTYPLTTVNRIARSASGDSKIIKGRLSRNPSPGLFPAFSASGQDVWHRDHKHSGVAIILSAVGARCGKCFLADGKWSAIANTHIIWPNSSLVEPRYLFLFLNDESFWIRGGSAQPFVKVRESLCQEIPLPSLSEQKRILERVDECFEKIEEISLLQDESAIQTDAIQPSLLSEVFDTLSASFRTVEIGKVALETRYGTSRKCSSNPEGVPILRIPNVIDGSVNFDGLKYCNLNSTELKRIALKDGDLLFVRTNGSRELVGRCAIFESEDSEGDVGFASYLIRVRLDQAKMLPHFLAYYLNSTHGRTELNKRRRTSAGQFNINSENLKSIGVPLPPIEIQRALIETFREQSESLDKLILEIRNARTEGAQLRTAILRKAFAGEL